MLDEKKVILAMSGGVDSSVAGWLLRRAGYDVTGVFLCLGLVRAGEPIGSEESRPARQGCCSPEDAADARRVAQALGIPLHVLDLSGRMEAIIDRFAAEYARGRTPNPCGLCNPTVKFGRLLECADQLGARYVATGHHARLVRASDGPAIHRGRAAGKDQSYVLFALPRAVLGRVLLPVGELEDKARVRGIAAELGLRVADKPDSQEICFAPDGRYADILRDRAPQALRPGPILDQDGRVLGEHPGIGHFTIGQRRGLRIAAGQPLYVTRIDPDRAAVTVGPRPAVQGRHLAATDANWHADVPEEPFEALVQVRSTHAPAAARVRRLGAERFTVEFAEPVHAIAPGQIAAVYRDDGRLLGGGWIDAAGG